MNRPRSVLQQMRDLLLSIPVDPDPDVRPSIELDQLQPAEGPSKHLLEQEEYRGVLALLGTVQDPDADELNNRACALAWLGYMEGNPSYWQAALNDFELSASKAAGRSDEDAAARERADHNRGLVQHALHRAAE